MLKVSIQLDVHMVGALALDDAAAGRVLRPVWPRLVSPLGKVALKDFVFPLLHVRTWLGSFSLARRAP